MEEVAIDVVAGVGGMQVEHIEEGLMLWWTCKYGRVSIDFANPTHRLGRHQSY